MNEQIISIWKYFHEFNVRYIIIGGFAVNVYGYNRNTGDLDVYLEDTLENRKNLKKAFVAIGIGNFESIETMQFVPGWTDFTLNYGLRLDIMTTVKGLENQSFDSLLEVATIVSIEKIPVNFIDYDNLIVSKKAANRLKDLLDIEELDKLNSKDDF
ncbi:nucleotidyltransferase [Flavobacterium branchiarum]|uniref:Nucleotidyltransferase n=1 Tax=Flavobacterium branchiarum TaxID=1114870 RepID=A0ABV5FHR3_9FLAO|nr:nucleotidyltransferase [Flavobacterium branchiarum]MDN3673988.1 nucleotidyltransferase [Flavobacterium branchiarum]